MTDAGERETWRRAPGVVTRRVAGEVVLVPVASGRQQRDTRFFVLNETAERLWSLLEMPHSAAELAQHLTTEFDVEASRARADVDAFLADLDAQGAIIRG